jgi:phospholipid N-methyltransferase
MNTEILEKHINNIAGLLKSLFGIVPIGKGFITKETLSEKEEYKKIWADGYEFTFYIRYAKLDQDHIKYLERFLGQQINVISTNGGVNGHRTSTVISFGGGNCSFTPIEISTHTGIGSDESEFRKLLTKVTIPEWLDRYVFESLQARFAPNHKKFARNLDLSDSEVKDYMGTYGLRSTGEAYIIFSDLFSNEKVYQQIKDIQVLNVLDFGAGTGGNLTGMILALSRVFEKSSRFECLMR